MSIIRFIKEWTLPVSMVTGTIIYLIFAFIPALDEAAVFFAPIFDTILPLFMFLILFVTFCKVDFHKLRPVHWHLWVGIFQVIFVLIIVGLILGFHMKGNSLILMEAILTCIIGPCAAAAAVVTQKLGGNLEEMTTYTFLSNIITAIMIPVCFPLIDNSVDNTFMTAFLKILHEVCIVLIVPMLLAYIVKHYFKLRSLFIVLYAHADLERDQPCFFMQFLSFWSDRWFDVVSDNFKSKSFIVDHTSFEIH
ncbi:MAG: hypothetical protein II624_06285 [Prevotella sp.]|nr:hypothetical protein [Prevotella sp.]